MKLSGSFVLREVAGEWLAIPVGETALKFGGMIVLNPTSRVIWETLQQNVTETDIVDAIMQRFEITAEEAQADVRAFLEQMKAESLVTE